ncbi:hypothetical protein CMV30_08235 [Nibricoccus aquaticus]|uniref:N-methyl-D-aspartate receptor NMDAR2C subunit n=1 Tax=Nibricoccus aquaticus TaxID=2576891 RepID=A0A290QHV6_9BACT|nr:hypothetical protein [Nibricoccus aquaticus]ATC63941.1 hypothetical protein CMV30_08235 [Nibricoccus aquaticus]
MTPAEATARWTQLCRSVRNSAEAHTHAQAWLPRLLAAYSEAHRHYHTFAHIADSLRHFDASRALAQNPRALEFALWLHDAIYDPRSPLNEESSAALARQFLHELGADDSLTQQVHALILATKTHTTPPLADSSLATDAALLIDIDLAILGQPPAAFDLYETQIRQEYAWATPANFAKRRSEILRHFLARPRLYTTDFFFTHLEPQARTNLTRSLQKLEAAP